MSQLKTLALPLFSALVAASAVPAGAQVSLSLSSEKLYRQFSKDNIKFRSGRFSAIANDGQVSSISQCNDQNYFPPGSPTICNPGTTGFLSSGNINGATIQRPYLVITSLSPAIVIEPEAADYIKLAAAPASTLPRPAGGFTDDSASVYYNLTTSNISEYKISRYFQTRNYNKNQRGKFESDIVPGAYHYVFPRLGRPDLPAAITAVIYPMPEGYATINKQKVGFRFTKVNNNKWTKKGFVQLSYLRPNKIEWTGFTPNVVFGSVDKLYFSVRAMRNPNDPVNSDVINGSAIFPAFTNTASAQSRVLLASPYVTSFTTPPIITGGTNGLVELTLERNMQTGGVTYDFSTRRFQIPVTVVDSYDDYASIFLKGAKKDILADPDKDGYNNLNEWILNSDANNSGSVPEMPYPAPFQAEDIFGFPTPIGSYYGFNVNIRKGTDPAVNYTLQRSTDNGVTWETFTTDANWRVERVTTIDRGVTTREIQVRSKVEVDPITETTPNYFMEPPGTASDMYRVKITLP